MPPKFVFFVQRSKSTKPKPKRIKRKCQRGLPTSLASFPTKQISRSTPAAVAVSEWLHIFHIPHQQRQLNHLEWKQTGTVGGWIWDQRKTHLHLSNICRGYLEKLDAFELRSGFWMILGISPYQEAKKHQGFMMSWWFRVLSFTVGTRSNKSARDITIITQPNRSEENTVILQIDRRNFQLLIPPVKFENVHFQMFSFRFFDFSMTLFGRNTALLNNHTIS